MIKSSYFDNETSALSDDANGLSLTTRQFLTPASFNLDWHINGEKNDIQPWIQVPGSSRPYLYIQDISATNELTSLDTLFGYAVENKETITSRGLRYTPITDRVNWIYVNGNSTSTGLDKMLITGVMDDIPYYLQSYVMSGEKSYFGELVRYTHYVNTFPDKPVVTGVHVDVTYELGNQLFSGRYDYFDPAQFSERGTLYQWYITDDIIGANPRILSSATDQTFIPRPELQDKYVYLEVTPFNGLVYGDPVSSNFYRVLRLQSIQNFSTTRLAYLDDVIPLEAEATSKLPIVYTSSDESVATIVGTDIIAVGVGVCNITASQQGNTIYAAAFPVVQVLTVEIFTGIDSPKDIDSQIRVYPNPLVDYVIFDMRSLSSNSPCQIRIFSMSGQLVYSNLTEMTGSEIRVDMQSIPAGIYIAEISTDQGKYHHRLVK